MRIQKLKIDQFLDFTAEAVNSETLKMFYDYIPYQNTNDYKVKFIFEHLNIEMDYLYIRATFKTIEELADYLIKITALK